MISNERSKIFIFDIWGLREILTQFYPFLAQRHAVITKICAPNFHTTPRTDMSALGSIYLVFASLKSYSSSYSLISTIFARKMTICAKSYFDSFIGVWFVSYKMKESDGIQKFFTRDVGSLVFTVYDRNVRVTSHTKFCWIWLCSYWDIWFHSELSHFE